MNSFDEKYSCISDVLNYKHLHLPTFKFYKTANYTCFNLMMRLPAKCGWVWDKWLVHIPTTETIRHCIFYDMKTNRLLGKGFKKVIIKKNN
jgi:hypothetical protein